MHGWMCPESTHTHVNGDIFLGADSDPLQRRECDSGEFLNVGISTHVVRGRGDAVCMEEDGSDVDSSAHDDEDSGIQFFAVQGA